MAPPHIAGNKEIGLLQMTEESMFLTNLQCHVCGYKSISQATKSHTDVAQRAMGNMIVAKKQHQTGALLACLTQTPTCWWWTHRLGARSYGQKCPWVLLNRLRSLALPVWCSPPPQRSGLPSCPRILPQASRTGLPTPAIVSLSAPV